KMYRFWQTLLLGEHTYYGSPLLPHLNMPVDKGHFKRWVSIFQQTVDDLFTGEVAKEAKWRGSRMAEMFNYKIEFFRDNAGAVQERLKPHVLPVHIRRGGLINRMFLESWRALAKL